MTTRKQVMMVSAGALLCLFAAPAGVLAGTPAPRTAVTAPSAIVAGSSQTGTIKVNNVGDPAPGGEKPHLDCADIQLWGDKMGTPGGSYSIVGKPPSGKSGAEAYPGAVPPTGALYQVPGQWTYDQAKGGQQVISVISVQALIANAIANGDAPHNKQGFHFKIDTTGTKKSKVFWVDCPGIPTNPIPTFTLSKAVDPSTSPVSIGTPLKYTITVKNTSVVGGDAGTVVDTITTSGGLTYTQVGGFATSQGSLNSVNPGVVNWAVGNLAAGASATLKYTLVPNSAGQLKDTVVNPNTNCPVPSTTPPCGTVTDVVAFHLSKSVSPTGAVPVGTALHYTLTVTNISTTVAGDPGTIQDNITTNGGATYSVTTAPAGPGTIGGADPHFTWQPGQLAAGASASLTMTLTVTGAGTAGASPAVNNNAVDNLTNCLDTNPPNVPPCGTTNPVTTYAMTKTVDEAGAQNVGTVLHYHVKIHNLSPTTAGDPGTVTDTISTAGGATYTILGAQFTQGAATINNPTITWVVGSLAGGATATLDIQLKITGAGAPAGAGVVSNTAVDVNTNCDAANNPVCTTHTPVLSPHLTLEKTVDQTSLTSLPGTVLYTVTVGNDGNAPASNVLVDDLLSGTAGFLVNDGTRGTTSSFVGSPVVTINPVGSLGGHYQWTYATVNPGDVDVVQFTVQMLLPGTVLNNTNGTVSLANTASVPSYSVPGTPTYINPGNNPSPVTVTTVAPYTCCATTATPGGVQGITDTPTTGASLNIELAGFLFLGGLGLILVGILARKPEGDIA